MRNAQERGRPPNSPANSLPTAFFGSKTVRNSAAGRVGQIVCKSLIYNGYPTLGGRSPEAKKYFFPAGREMRPSQPWPPALHRRCGALMAQIPCCATCPGRARLRIGIRSAQGNPFDRPHRVRGQWEILTRCLGRRRAPSGSAPKANARRSSS